MSTSDEQTQRAKTKIRHERFQKFLQPFPTKTKSFSYFLFYINQIKQAKNSTSILLCNLILIIFKNRNLILIIFIIENDRYVETEKSHDKTN